MEADAEIALAKGELSLMTSIKIFLTTPILVALAHTAHARPIDWKAELERCQALRENVTPLLRAGEGQSVSRSATAMRRCAWIEHQAKRKKLT
ncbi:MAG TPA: hypothetical protein VF396_14390 [Bradyrhizobium sp.]